MSRKGLVTIFLGIVVLVGTFFLFKKISSKEEKDKEMPRVVVPTVVVEEVTNSTVPIQTKANGSLVAKDRMELFSEVQGIMKRGRKVFKPGVRFSKGETLIAIDGDEYYASLQSQKSNFLSLVTAMMPDLRLDYPASFIQWQAYLEAFDMNKTIKELPEPKDAKEKMFLSGKNIYSNYYTVKNMELKWNKYRIRAPFSGVLTEVSATPGTLIRSGQKIGEFVNTSVYELEVSLASSVVNSLSINKKVLVMDLESGEKWTGEISRINAKLDQSSQTTRVFVEVQGDQLREGKYLSVVLNLSPVANACQIRRELLVNENKVYVVEDGKIKIAEVQVKYLGEEKAVIAGLNNGTKLVSKPIPGLYPDMEVKLLANQ